MSQSLFLYFLGSDSGTHVVKTAPRFPSVPTSKPMVEAVIPTHPPKVGTNRERSCVCVCYRGQNTVLSGSQRVHSLRVRSKGQRKTIQAVVQQRQQQRRQQRPSPASFVSECRGNGRHRGSSSPRQSKQDRWAQAWHD